ncbi:hypothetical protein C1645_835314 [Glomus cerebriforme]|uniref:CCHC-type domain-containing protein n=1 Tax=Glomus cerebriforme TaxID=658196 RepID=A0A397SDZ4_9GLOM|nr:hypothetical protein C1645_865600 [Glomus cerebriforme]RIA82465.1 hypothetical protein C1645_835314 [Glomus cerebriforme]
MSSVRSNKSSTGTLRRVTRSQSTANITENNKNTTNIENEKNIALETYGPSPNTNNPPKQDQAILNNIENTPVETTTIPTSDRDIIMGNTIDANNSLQQNSSPLPAITTPHQNLAHSIHASEKGKTVLHKQNNNENSTNIFTTLYTPPPNVDNHTTSNYEPINNDFNDANNITSISDTENLTINDNTDTYISFALLNDLPYNTIHEIKTEIRRNFLNTPAFKGFMGLQNYYGIKVIKIGFYEEADRNSIHNIYISNLKTRFYNYEPQYIEQIITPILESKYNKTIKIVDIPKHIDNSLIIEVLSKEIGPICNYYEPIKSYNKNNPQSQNLNRQQQQRPSYFKQLKIEFENTSSIQNIVQNDIWSITIGDFSVRILPNEIKSIGYINRTSYQYKLTGLPINSTIKSIEPLLKKIKARTCTFTPTDKRRITKSAYVYVSKEDFINKNKTLNINNHNIYIMNPKLKHCTVCGSPTHDFKSCNSTANLTPNKHTANNQNRLTLSQFNNKFKSLIQTPLKKPDLSRNSKRPLNTRNPQQTYKAPVHKADQPSDRKLIEQLLKENAELKTLLHQSIQKLNNLQSITKDIAEIKKNVLDNKEKIAQTNTKIDIVITRTEELNQNVLNINVLNEKPQSTYRRKREKLSSSTPKDNTNKFSFNPQIDSFSDIGSLKTISSIPDNANKSIANKNDFSIPLTIPKHLINETESEIMESMVYEESPSQSVNDNSQYDYDNNLGETSTSQWNFNPLKNWKY